MRHIEIILSLAVAFACASPVVGRLPDAGEAEPDSCELHGGDSDDDGLCDAFDNCIAVANPDQADLDGDGRGDECDPPEGKCDAHGGDIDEDGVCDAFDNCLAFANADQGDADGDGLGDLCEKVEHRCDAFGGDLDEDGVCDALDNCIAVANADQVDSDGDGRGDSCDPPGHRCDSFGGDSDGDGICDAFDNCLAKANEDQADADGDGRGDACDSVAHRCDGHGGDFDGDEICDAFDNCVAVPNRDQADADGDGLGDLCDQVHDHATCAGRGHDDDLDDVCSAFDNCPDDANPGQEDRDRDGLGDACDPTPNPCDDAGGDTDADTICDGFDNCPLNSNITQVDFDGDGVGDVCDPDPPYVPGPAACAGLGGDVDADDLCGLYDNCPAVTNPLQEDRDGDGLGDVCDTETCDGVDNDGDGLTDEGFPDDDGDGVANCQDVCPAAADVDGDLDGLIDCLDPCPGDAANDADKDGVCSAGDNCPSVSNYTQSDRDGDGIGDHCDVEECDGISNDADTLIDEGMPDQDGDGVCDEIDECPADALNDPDEDGLCGLVDNCPTVANLDQTDGDGDGRGDVCDLDSNVSCGAPASASSPGAVPFPSSFKIGGIVGRVTSDVIFVSFRSTSPAYPNRIAAVHAPTTSVLWTVDVGSDPGPMAVSDDGTLLYVGLNGAAQIKVVQVANRRSCRSFPIGNTTYYGPLFAGDLDVVPGDAGRLVVSSRRKGVSPDFGGVFLFEHGVVLPDHTGDHTGARLITVASSTTVYGYNNSSTEYGLRELELSDSGVSELWVQRDLVSGFNLDITYVDGRIFSSSGRVVDPVARTILGTFPVTGPVSVDTAARLAYVLSAASTLSVLDVDTFLPVRTTSLPVSLVGTSGTPPWNIRWGTRGIALATESVLHVRAFP